MKGSGNEPPRRLADIDGPSIARDRYIQSLSSNIFAAPEPKQPPAVPVGKRRDHTHNEVFTMASAQHDLSVRDLRRAPDTFIPRDLPYTARDRREHEIYGSAAIYKASQCAPAPETDLTYPLNKMDNHKRLPHADVRVVSPHDEDLMPSTNIWSGSHKQNFDYADSTKLRGAYQGVSHVFGDKSAEEQVRLIHEQSAHIQDDTQGDEDRRRRYDQQYSNIFNKEMEKDTKLELLDTNEIRRIRPSAAHEGLTPFHDAMDSRIELLPHCRNDAAIACGEGTSYHKAMNIKYRSNVPGLANTHADSRDHKITFHDDTFDKGPARPSVNDARSNKMFNMQSTLPLARQGALEEAEKVKGHFDVVALNIRGLKPETTERDMRQLAQKLGCHVARLQIQLDPITHTCKGRARVVIRESGDIPSASKFIDYMLKQGYVCEAEPATDISF